MGLARPIRWLALFLSPYTTLAGEDTAVGYLVSDRSRFAGSYLIDTINANGTGKGFDNNFNMGIHNFNLSTINAAATAVINLINWGASLNSRISNIYGNTSGICINVEQSDGTRIEDVTCNISPVEGQTTLIGQAIVFNHGNLQQQTNVMSRLKLTYAGAYGSGPLNPGYLPSSGNYIFEIGQGVQGLSVDGLNIENAPTGISIDAGSHDIFIKNMQQFLDCGTGCKVQNYCENIIDPNTYNIHLEGTMEGFKFAVCIGHLWHALTAYSTGQTFIIDPRGHIQKATTAGTSGATQPKWNDSGGTTTDGTAAWTDQGVLSTVCDPTQYNAPQTFDNAGLMVNCAIPTVNLSAVNVGRLTLTGPLGQSNLADNAKYGFIYDSNTFWNTPPTWSPTVIATLTGANFNTTADQPLSLHFPPSAGKMVITAVYASGFSSNVTTAQGGIYFGPGKTGCTVVPASQFWGTTASPATNLFVTANVARGTCADMGNSSAGNTYGQAAAISQGLYFSLTTPQGAPATGNITVIGYPIH